MIGNKCMPVLYCILRPVHTFPFSFECILSIRACLHEGGGPQIGEVTPLGGVKNNPPLHAILQPRHPGVHSRLLNGR